MNAVGFRRIAVASTHWQTRLLRQSLWSCGMKLFPSTAPACCTCCLAVLSWALLELGGGKIKQCSVWPCELDKKIKTSDLYFEFFNNLLDLLCFARLRILLIS